MKKLLILMMLCSTAFATSFTSLQFGVNQVADTQWDTGNCLSSSTCTIYSKNVGGTYETGGWTPLTSGEYIQFVSNTGSNSSTYPWQMNLYNSNGTLNCVLGVGRILVEGTASDGNSYFFFTNASYNGSLFSTTYGMNNSNGLTFTGTENPTVSQTNTFSSSGSTTPLGSGQTATPAPTYSSSITTAEQTALTANQTATSSVRYNNIYIDQIGSNDHVSIIQNTNNNNIVGYSQNAVPIRGGSNTITMRQGDPNNSSSGHNTMQVDVLGGGGNTLNLNQGTDTNGNGTGTDTGYHYLGLQINGSSNIVTTQQQTTYVGVGNYAQISLTGNANNVGVYQTGSAPQQSFNSINGNTNTLSVTQSGTSTHFSDVTLTGTGNSATINQSNTGATGSNAATIVLNNAGGATSLNLTQTGGQVYSINQTCTNAAGCGTITVKQGN